jgi:carbon starvation protein
MNSLVILAVAACFFVLAYRYYAAFIAAKVAVTDPSNPTPAHKFRDGKDYHPTNRVVLFGHHFAAIAGAGPLVGPVLAAQYGYLPGALWILFGAVFAGGVQDFIILYASVRHRGQSISYIAEKYLGSIGGWCTALSILFIIIVALAGLAAVVVKALAESAWGTFTIACSIPIAFLMGQWMYKIRPGRIAEASAIGVILLLGAVALGRPIALSHMASWFLYSENTIKIILPTYGFIAAALPVWMLLCPRDYLSTYMKLGTVAVLAVGVAIVHPRLEIPMTTQYMSGGGPIISGPVWPYVCLTIACGAISGFHALISSGTTPKMINSEADMLPIGYGAMLTEGFVAMLALITACTLSFGIYKGINAKPETGLYKPVQTELVQISKRLEVPSRVVELSLPEGKRKTELPGLAGRTGGAVTLAVGMSDILGRIPLLNRIKGIFPYWYYFAIMFEALFILTTIDTGTRVARFILQEMLGRVSKPLGSSSWIPGVIITSAAVSVAWWYLVWNGSIDTIWRMFGVANQLLGCIALSIGTTFILRRSAKRIYALVTFVPMVFMVATVFTGGIQNTIRFLVPPPGIEVQVVNGILTVIMLGLALVVVANSLIEWYRILSNPKIPWDEKDDTPPVGEPMVVGQLD